MSDSCVCPRAALPYTVTQDLKCLSVRGYFHPEFSVSTNSTPTGEGWLLLPLYLPVLSAWVCEFVNFPPVNSQKRLFRPCLQAPFSHLSHFAALSARQYSGLRKVNYLISPIHTNISLNFFISVLSSVRLIEAIFSSSN